LSRSAASGRRSADSAGALRYYLPHVHDCPADLPRAPDRAGHRELGSGLAIRHRALVDDRPRRWSQAGNVRLQDLTLITPRRKPLADRRLCSRPAINCSTAVPASRPPAPHKAHATERHVGSAVTTWQVV
jgi:hypothetical protein